jgi:hypothetical protein
MYFENNLTSLINLLKCVQEFKTPYFVFSSSCTVYGNPDQIPVTEQTPPKPAESPYVITKQMGEQIINEFAKAAGPMYFYCGISTRLVLIHPFLSAKCLSEAAKPGTSHYTNCYREASQIDRTWS